ncbi:MAG: hypothetical protein AAGI38_07200 [Bacteroidota bacterium]
MNAMMNWLNKVPWYQSMRVTFSRRRIRYLERSRKYVRDFVDIENARNVGLIVNINECTTEDIKTLRRYIDQLKKGRKQVFLIELNFLKKSVPTFNSSVNSIFINPSKLNWLDFPVQSVEGKIRQYDLDILMNFDESDRMTSKYLCSMANAKTRTGKHTAGFESCYELMVNFPIRSDVTRMKTKIKEFDYFLKMLEK